MVFSDLLFLLVFLPLFALLYALGGLLDGKRFGGAPKTRNFVLVVFSLIFYAWGEPVYVFLMLGSVVLNYIAGRIIDSTEKGRKAALAAGVAVNLLILGTFKYAGFFAGCLRGLGLDVPDPGIALPIGISFYTFQSISYLVDVYRRESPAQKNFMGLLLYISMFPQLIAGPIVRYNTVSEGIRSRSVSREDVAEGMFRFTVGLGKKVILANIIGETATQLLSGGGATVAGAWVGILAFTLQIYFDFSGYSDMAIGIGRCIGFRFPENFRHPYCCNSITDFWRRWHISLGSFFRDYLYIPLGGNRRHQALNILIVWLLTGMWHGASWNFILWGLYFGLIVMLEKYTLLRWKKIPASLLHLYSLLLVILGWGIFYFEDFGQMGVFFRNLFGGAPAWSDIEVTTALTGNFWIWIAAIALCLPVREWIEKRLSPGMLTGGRIVVSIVLLAASVMLLVGATNNAFLYTRF